MRPLPQLLVDATHAPTGESGGGCRPAARTLGRHGARRLGVIGGHVHPQPEVTLQLQAGDPVKAPHLLLVHASGLTAADVGAVHATTPTLARLLTQGVRLSSLYMASTVPSGFTDCCTATLTVTKTLSFVFVLTFFRFYRF